MYVLILIKKPQSTMWNKLTLRRFLCARINEIWLFFPPLDLNRKALETLWHYVWLYSVPLFFPIPLHLSPSLLNSLLPPPASTFGAVLPQLNPLTVLCQEAPCDREVGKFPLMSFLQWCITSALSPLAIPETSTASWIWWKLTTSYKRY